MQKIIWDNLVGGYKILYNPSLLLEELKLTIDEERAKIIFQELWDNLHHQGDVGLASYYSVIELVDICISKKSVDWNFIGLCLTIEHCRTRNTNPELPREVEINYFDSLKKFENYLLANFANIKNEDSILLTLSFLATLSGQIDLGKAIALLDNDLIKEIIDGH